MERSRYDVFISYRREDGAELAQLVRKFLMDRGLKVFLDVRELGAGHFDTALLRIIAATPNFILVLGPKSLARCGDKEDWLAKEIIHAIRTARHIVPMVTGDFAFPEISRIPEAMAEILRYQCAVYDHRFSDESLAKMLQMLDLKKKPLLRRFFWPAFVFLFLALAAFVFFKTGLLVSPRGEKQALSQASDTERTFAYSVLVQKYRDGKPFKEPFSLAKEIVFEPDYQIRILLSSRQPGHLYIFNEGPENEKDMPAYNILFPSVTANQGSSAIAADQQVQIPEKSWLVFDQQSGTEKLWLVWSKTLVPEFEEIKAVANPTDRGAVGRPEQVAAIREFLGKHSNPAPSTHRDEILKQTVVGSEKDILVYLLQLEHH